MLHRVALVRTDISEELSASIMRVTRIGELGTAKVVPSSPILVTLMMEALSSSEMSVLTRATRWNIPEDAILHSHRRETLKSYTEMRFPRKLTGDWKSVGAGSAESNGEYQRTQQQMATTESCLILRSIVTLISQRLHVSRQMLVYCNESWLKQFKQGKWLALLHSANLALHARIYRPRFCELQFCFIIWNSRDW
jgi:hypothetical protein